MTCAEILDVLLQVLTTPPALKEADVGLAMGIAGKLGS